MTTNTANQPIQPPRKRGRRYGLLIVGIGIFTIYWGYCWGWWLRDNLIAQSLFQCVSIPGSEQARYAPFEVLVSACEKPGLVWVTPEGTDILVAIKQPNGWSIRHFDRQTPTQEELIHNLPSEFSMDVLGNDLLFIHQNYNQNYLFQIHARQSWPITKMITQPLTDLRWQTTLQEPTGQIILLYSQTIILPDTYAQHPDRMFYIPGDYLQSTVILPDLMQHQIPYRDLRSYPPTRSPDGQWDATTGGLVAAATGQVVIAPVTNVPGEPMEARGWIGNGQQVIYFRGKAYVFDSGGIGPSFWSVPQPVLLLRVPKR